MNENQKILNLAVLAGEILIRSGGEIYRVEDTIRRIIEAYGIEDYHVYVLSNGIFASLESPKEPPYFLVRHVTFGIVHLERITAVNQLSREICANPISPGDALEKMRLCENLNPYPLWQKGFASGLGCAAFSLLFGGSAFDSLLSFVIGWMLEYVLSFFRLRHFPRFFYTIAASAFVTGCTILPFTLHLPLHVDMVIIGCIMPLVPGLALTNSIRDFFNVDYLSGVIHLVDALLTSVSIAAGVGFIMTMYQFFGGNLT